MTQYDRGGCLDDAAGRGCDRGEAIARGVAGRGGGLGKDQRNRGLGCGIYA